MNRFRMNSGKTIKVYAINANMLLTITPKPFRPVEGENRTVNTVERIVLPNRLSTVTNREEFLFEGAEPVYRTGGGIIY